MNFLRVAYLKWQLERGYRRQAIIRLARASAARKGHVAAVHRQFQRDPIVREYAR